MSASGDLFDSFGGGELVADIGEVVVEGGTSLAACLASSSIAPTVSGACARCRKVID
jgi:hypothetical protein